ncbi:MAG: Gfo/Idh/MocA family oxidoreductase, partial [Verrucomicrobiaceae bacterium]|nr:Gfo/Idh/MocA family oxidoreductase [Verrucomicrobiaceae bacterium]
MNPTAATNRRSFLQNTAAAASTLILPSGLLRGESARKLNIGFIGMGGQIQGHVSKIVQIGHHVGALCDVDSAQIENSKKRHGAGVADAAVYSDYRVLLEKEKSLDAVVIATPDHWHATICRAVMNTGKHVYCEKPLTHTIAEARELREMARTAKVITQTGNQGSASPNLRRSMELIGAGFFGAISDIHVWHPTHSWPSGE